MVRNFTSLRTMPRSRYDTIVAKLNGEFNVPQKQRTADQVKALNVIRKRNDFALKNGHLLCHGKRVIADEDLPYYVERSVKENHGCGSRVLYRKLKEKYTGFTEKSIIRVLEKSKYYHRTYPRFTNKPVPKTVKASGPGRRWQIDIVSMKGFEVRSGGSTFRYILQIIDVHSRYIIPQSLQTKTSKEVAIALEKVMLNHGSPELIQCDNGREFQGLAMKELLKKYNIKIVHGRPYYPQAQGKCERSNRLLKQRILFACRRKRRFNWVSGLQRIAYAINTSAKRVLGSLTPFQVYYRRDHVTNSPLPEMEIKKKILNAERSFRRRQLKKAHRPSTYHIGERVLLKFPFTKTRVPTKRHIILGTVLDRMAGRRYLVSFSHPASKTKTPVKQWIGVESITSTTVERERVKQTVANKQETNSGRMIRKSHRNTYYQVLSHNDKIKTLTRRKVQTGVQVLFDPRPDGNCQFSAISHQLQRYGIYCSASNLRQKSVEHLQTWRNFYENFVHGTSFKEYLSAMANNGTYGDNLTLVALMREFNMQCYVVSTRGREENALVSNDGTYDINLPLITLGYFPENEGMHYVSVLVQPEAMQNWVEQNVDLATNVSEDEVMTDDGPENVDSPLAGDGPEDVDSPLAEDGPEDVGSPLAGDGPEDVDSPFAGDRPEDVDSPLAGDWPEDVDSPFAGDRQEDLGSPFAGDGPEDVDSPLAGDWPEDVDSPFAGDRQEDVGSPFAGDRQEDVGSPFAGDGPEDVDSPLAGDWPEDVDSPFAGDRQEDVGRPFAGDRQEDVGSPFAGDGPQDVDSPLSGAMDVPTPQRKDDARGEEACDVSTGEEAGEVSAGDEADEFPTRNKQLNNYQTLMMQVLNVRNGRKVKRTFEKGILNLPVEILEYIFKITINAHQISRYALMKVCPYFRRIVRGINIPLPNIHISSFVIDPVPKPVSVRKLMRRSGSRSGLSIAIKGIISEPKWCNAWLMLQQVGIGWYSVTDIYYCNKNWLL